MSNISRSGYAELKALQAALLTTTADMVLAGVQTITGIKTFLDGKMILRNVANTFNGVFTNTNTANRTYTLKDADGTIAFTSDITGTNSGTNTGDQTTIVGITGTIAQFNTACTDADFATGGGTVTGTSSGTNTGDQTSIAGISGTMAQFDSACSNGDFMYVGVQFSGLAKITVGTSAPGSPATGDLWCDTN